MGSWNYCGQRKGGAAQVMRYRPQMSPEHGQPLDPRLDFLRHSPTGLEWGYAGSGPSQLSFALLSDFLGDDAAALELYQEFKRAVVELLPRDGWTMTESGIAAELEAIKRDRGAWSAFGKGEAR